MSADPYLHPRALLVECMDRIYGYRMTTTSGGNISIREESGEIWITPARLDKGRLQAHDIVHVAADGSWEGPAKPSSELPLHQIIYRARPDVRAIVHAHPVALVAFSIVHDVPDTRVFHQGWRTCGEPVLAPYRLPGSAELGDAIAGALAAEHSCAILENHGVVTVGGDLAQAFRRFEALEFVGKTIIKARLLGNEVHGLSDAELALTDGHVAALEPLSAQTPGNRERELRAQLAEFVLRGYDHRLFISAHGTFSARVDDASFVITPHHVDRGALTPADFVLVAGGRAAPGPAPSHAARVHAAIYRRHPQIAAIAGAAPVNATAFSITGSVPDTRTIPESRVVVRQPARVPYGLQFEDPDSVAALITPQSPIAMLDNDGVLTTGRDVLEAFDRLEVLESTAEALINARALGTLAPMGDDVLADLEAAFPTAD